MEKGNRQDEQDGQDGKIDRVYLVYSDTLSVFAFAGAVLRLKNSF